MFTKKQWDKEYPEPTQCLENDTICDFDVERICHECGKPLCESCAVGIRHQPRLVKYRSRELGEEKRVEYHCQDPECLSPHYVDTQRLLGGLGGVALGVLILWTVGASSTVLALLAIAAIVIGGYVAYKEWKLKQPLNERVTLFDQWPDSPI